MIEAEAKAEMEKHLIGKFKRIAAENYEELLKGLGVNVIFRKIATASTPMFEVSRNGDTWTFQTSTALRAIQLSFQVGVPFEELSPDGREVTSVVTQDGNKFICIQNAKKIHQRSTRSIREFTADRCICYIEILGSDPPIICKQVFKRIE